MLVQSEPTRTCDVENGHWVEAKKSQVIHIFCSVYAAHRAQNVHLGKVTPSLRWKKMQTMKGNQLPLLLFNRTGCVGDRWTCNAGSCHVAQWSPGYMNRCDHVSAHCHHSFAAAFCQRKNVIRRHFCHSSIFLEPTMRYLARITALVEDKIKELVSDHFEIVFDGWPVADAHYVSMLLTLPADRPCGVDTVFLQSNRRDLKSHCLRRSKSSFLSSSCLIIKKLARTLLLSSLTTQARISHSRGLLATCSSVAPPSASI